MGSFANNTTRPPRTLTEREQRLLEPITERAVRRVVRASGWEEQRNNLKSLDLQGGVAPQYPDLVPA